jgi:hypothetical protein
MISVSIGRLDYTDSQDWFALTGAVVLDGLVSGDYLFNPGDAETTSETIQLHLRGPRNQLRKWLDRLEIFQQQSEDLYLRLWHDDLQEFGYARIHRLTIKTLPGHLASLARGSFELDLEILRDTFFFSDEEPLPLVNSFGLPQINGLTIYNHNDSADGHDNWFSVDPSSLDLKFPALIRFQYENNFIGPDLGEFCIGSLPVRLGGPRPNLTLEAEDGSGGSVVSHSQASGGKYCQYRWSGSAWQSLASWVLGPIEVSQLAAGSISPLLRFFSPLPSSSLQLRIAVNLQGKLVFEGPATHLETGKRFAQLDPLFLPLGELPMKNYASQHQVVLQAKQTDAGEHLLEVDDLLLLPQHGFSGYHSLSGLKYSQKIVEDEVSGKSWSLDDGLEFKSHARFGSGLGLQASLPQHFWCFQSDVNGLASIERTLSVRAWYRRQWRLP